MPSSSPAVQKEHGRFMPSTRPAMHCPAPTRPRTPPARRSRHSSYARGTGPNNASDNLVHESGQPRDEEGPRIGHGRSSKCGSLGAESADESPDCLKISGRTPLVRSPAFRLFRTPNGRIRESGEQAEACTANHRSRSPSQPESVSNFGSPAKERDADSPAGRTTNRMFVIQSSYASARQSHTTRTTTVVVRRDRRSRGTAERSVIHQGPSPVRSGQEGTVGFPDPSGGCRPRRILASPSGLVAAHCSSGGTVHWVSTREHRSSIRTPKRLFRKRSRWSNPETGTALRRAATTTLLEQTASMVSLDPHRGHGSPAGKDEVARQPQSFRCDSQFRSDLKSLRIRCPSDRRSREMLPSTRQSRSRIRRAEVGTPGIQVPGCRARNSGAVRTQCNRHRGRIRRRPEATTRCQRIRSPRSPRGRTRAPRCPPDPRVPNDIQIHYPTPHSRRSAPSPLRPPECHCPSAG